MSVRPGPAKGPNTHRFRLCSTLVKAYRRITLPPIALIIFDCDGVLIDSEPLAHAVLLETIHAAGGRLTAEQVYRRFLGTSATDVATTLRSEYGLDLSVDTLHRTEPGLLDRFTTELQPMAGIHATLAQLHQPVCVASSSSPPRLRHSLAVTGLLAAFEPHVFSAAQVPNGKPAPDLFLFAARTLNTAPQHCLVIEDSPAGIQAARRAGMRVVGFTGGTHALPADLDNRLRAHNPDAVIDDLRQLPALLTTLTDPPDAAPCT